MRSTAALASLAMFLLSMFSMFSMLPLSRPGSAATTAPTAPSGRQPPSEAPSDEDESPSDEALLAWLREHRQDPAGFIALRFVDHDVVLLGEHHEVRENCELVASLIPALAEAGVDAIGSEFFRSAQQADVDRLVRGDGEAFDEALGIRILRELPWPTWGYREYLDIARAVWRFNHAHFERDGAHRAPTDRDPDGALAEPAEPPTEPPFRLIGLDSDWSQVALWSRPDDAAARMAATLDRENRMVAVVEREVLAKGRKSLLHVGFAHSVLDQGLRLGTQLRREHGSRVGQVVLHHACEATPVLERVLEAAGGGACGFPVVGEGSPLAGLRAVEMRMGPRSMVFRLGDLAEGWVFLKPVDRLRKVRWIDGFVDDEHFESARLVAVRRGWIDAETDVKTAAELDAKIAEAFR